ncbi:ligand-gated channel protein [Rhizorhabdus wittichii DC-6]|nr:ligand-gated channel protein [Rhizorhabdus wittichii DC-6]
MKLSNSAAKGGAIETTRAHFSAHGAMMALAVASVGFWNAAAHAQVDMAAQAEAAGADEIVVTARKRQEASQNVPLSVAAFNGEMLQSRSVTTVSDIQGLVPGLHYQERGNLQTELTIRGVGGDARNPGIDAGVGMYIDGAYIPRTSGYNADLSDIAQVEVLRGPQGTLFGKNTIGGVINIVTKKPTEELTGFVYGSYGNYDAVRTQAAISGGLAPALSAKVTVASWNRQGYIRNRVRNERLNNEDRLGGRLQLRYNPGTQLDVNFSVDGTRDRRRGVLNQIGSPAGAAAPYFTGNRFVMDADQRNSDARDMWGMTLGIDYVLANDMTITSVTAYRDIDILVYSDIDQTPLDLFHSGPFTDDTTMISQELRLVSPGNKPFRYVLGLFGYKQDIDSDRDIFINGARSIVLDTAANTDSYAAFGNFDYDLTSQLTATVGLRYSIDKKDGKFNQQRTGLDYAIPLKRTDKNLSWTGSLLYKITPRLSTYATVSRGFKAGGFNLDTAGAVGLTASDLNFLPERVTNYEVGLKGRATDWMRFSLAVFQMDYKNKQVSQFVNPPVGNVPVVLVTNAGQARIKGVEFDTTLTPVHGLSLSGNVSYLDAKYRSFPNAAVVGGVLVSYTGNRVERTPKWTAGGSIDYRHPIGSGDLVMGANVSYNGAVDLQPDNLPRNYEGSYTLVDARFGYEMADGKWGLYLWGKNLTKENFATFKRQFAGLDQVAYGAPRTYGVEARFKF